MDAELKRLKDRAEAGEWWLAKSLSMEAREKMTPEQRAERRLMMVHYRLEEAEKRLTTARQRRMSRWLGQWIRGVAFKEMADKGHTQPLKRWLRDEFMHAVAQMLKERSLEGVVGEAIRTEVGRAIYGGYTSREQQRDYLTKYIDRIVKEEVKKQVMEALTFDVTVKGRVFTPAVGQRRVDIGGDDGEDMV